MARVTLIDNYDSFTWNLVHYLGSLGAEVSVHRNDEVSAAEVMAGRPDAIVLSPGPCTPREAGICLDLIHAAGDEVPLLEEWRHGIREENFCGDPVLRVLFDTGVAVPTAIGRWCQQVGEGVHIRCGPGIKVVVPLRVQIGPVILDVTTSMGVTTNDGVTVIVSEFHGHERPPFFR
jgi:hypothetical protein